MKQESPNAGEGQRVEAAARAWMPREDQWPLVVPLMRRVLSAADEADRVAGVVRIDAQDEALIERLASEAFFSDDIEGHHTPAPLVYSPFTWENIPEVGRENYRRLIRAVLAAAGAQPPKEDHEQR